MTAVTVRPGGFSMVLFEPDRIAAITAEVAALAGLPAEVDVVVDVDETTPFGGTRIDFEEGRVVLAVEGGALEDPKSLRHLSEWGARAVLARLLFRARDRLDPAFGDPPPDAELDLAAHAAWDTYAVGRYARRSGTDPGEGRRRYAFRLRHGFTDVADRTFEALWSAEDLAWSDLEAACATTTAAR